MDCHRQFVKVMIIFLYTCVVFASKMIYHKKLENNLQFGFFFIVNFLERNNYNFFVAFIIMPLSVFYTPDHARHNPKTNTICGKVEYVEGSDHGHPECPSRFPSIYEALQKTFPSCIITNCTREAEHTELKKCHNETMINFLFTAYEKAKKQGISHEEIVPSISTSFVNRYIKPHRPQQDVVAETGHFCFDTCTPIGEYSIECARQSAAAAIDAAKQLNLDDNNSLTYVLARPPGHHASYDFIGGFCFFNSAALASAVLFDRLNENNDSTKKHVAIIDIDFHHGNGTQDIFYTTSDIVYTSIHADPDFEYPHFTGKEHEIGCGDGEGANFNYPLPPETSFDYHYIPAMNSLISNLKKFNIGAIVVSLGMDAMDGDTVGCFHLIPENYHTLGTMIHDNFHVPTIIVQEGGYNKNRAYMASGIMSFINGLIG